MGLPIRFGVFGDTLAFQDRAKSPLRDGYAGASSLALVHAVS